MNEEEQKRFEDAINLLIGNAYKNCKLPPQYLYPECAGCKIAEEGLPCVPPLCYSVKGYFV